MNTAMDSPQTQIAQLRHFRREQRFADAYRYMARQILSAPASTVSEANANRQVGEWMLSAALINGRYGPDTFRQSSLRTWVFGFNERARVASGRTPLEPGHNQLVSDNLFFNVADAWIAYLEGIGPPITPAQLYSLDVSSAIEDLGLRRIFWAGGVNGGLFRFPVFENRDGILAHFRSADEIREWSVIARQQFEETLDWALSHFSPTAVLYSLFDINPFVPEFIASFFRPNIWTFIDRNIDPALVFLSGFRELFKYIDQLPADYRDAILEYCHALVAIVRRVAGELPLQWSGVADIFAYSIGLTDYINGQTVDSRPRLRSNSGIRPIVFQTPPSQNVFRIYGSRWGEERIVDGRRDNVVEGYEISLIYDPSGQTVYFDETDGNLRFPDGRLVPETGGGAAIRANLLMRSPSGQSRQPVRAGGSGNNYDEEILVVSDPGYGNAVRTGFTSLSAILTSRALNIQNVALAAVVDAAVREASDTIVTSIMGRLGIAVLPQPTAPDAPNGTDPFGGASIAHRLQTGIVQGVTSSLVTIVTSRLLQRVGIDGIPGSAVTNIISRTVSVYVSDFLGLTRSFIPPGGIAQRATLGQSFAKALEQWPTIVANIGLDLLGIDNPVSRTAGNIASAMYLAAEGAAANPYVAAAILVVTVLVFEVFSFGPNPSIGPIGSIDLAMDAEGAFAIGAATVDRNGFEGPDDQLTVEVETLMSISVAVLNAAIAVVGAKVNRLPANYSFIRNYALLIEIHSVVGRQDADSQVRENHRAFGADSGMEAVEDFVERVLRAADLGIPESADSLLVFVLRRGWYDWVINSDDPDYRATLPSDPEVYGIFDQVNALLVATRSSTLRRAPRGTAAEIIAGLLAQVRMAAVGVLNQIMLAEQARQQAGGPFLPPGGLIPEQAYFEMNALIGRLADLAAGSNVAVTRLFEADSGDAGIAPDSPFYEYAASIAGWLAATAGSTAATIAAAIALDPPAVAPVAGFTATGIAPVQEDGSVAPRIHAQWQPVGPGESVELRWQETPGTGWQARRVGAGASVEALPAVQGRGYRLQARRVAADGRLSDWTPVVDARVDASLEGARVVRLELAESADGVRFTGGDVRLRWDGVFPDSAFPLGTEPRGAGTSRPSPYLRGYIVRIHDADTGALLREGPPQTGTEFLYTLDDNRRDGGAAGPRRRLRVTVAMAPRIGPETGAATITVENPVPALPAVTIVPGLRLLALEYDGAGAADADYAGLRVWVSTQPGIDPGSPPTLLHRGRGGAVLHGLEPGTLHHLRWQPFDAFGWEGCPVSAEATARTLQLAPADLAARIVGASALAEELGRRIDLVDAPESVPASVAARLAGLAGSVDTRLTDVESRSTALTADVADARARVTAVETAVAQSGAGALAAQVSTLSTTVAGHTTSIQTAAASIDGLRGQYTVKIDANGHVAGFGLAAGSAGAGGATSEFVVRADRFMVAAPGQAPSQAPFVIGNWNGQPRVVVSAAAIGDASIRSAAIESLSADKITTGTLNAANIAVVNLNASHINAGVLNADLLQIGGVRTDRLQLNAVTESRGERQGLPIPLNDFNVHGVVTVICQVTLYKPAEARVALFGSAVFNRVAGARAVEARLAIRDMDNQQTPSAFGSSVLGADMGSISLGIVNIDDTANQGLVTYQLRCAVLGSVDDGTFTVSNGGLVALVLKR